MTKPRVAIIGGGAAGIMCACHLDPELFDVHIYEKTSRLGRKLLVAGEGGFNLTYHEPVADMQAKYLPKGRMDRPLDLFSNKDLRHWLAGIGIETYVGTSKRVFPIRKIKPYMVVDAMLSQLAVRTVTVHTKYKWLGWVEGALQFEVDGEEQVVEADIVVLALGGGSWAKTGSDGSWIPILQGVGVPCHPLQPSNCGWLIKWPKELVRLSAGQPLKNVVLTVGGQSVRGELVITDYGLEGGAIYAQAASIRAEIASAGTAELVLDLKPDSPVDTLVKRLSHRKKSIKHTLVNELKLSVTSYRLVNNHLSKDEYNDPHQLARSVKHFVLKTTKAAPLDDAISTAGGVAWSAIDDDYQLKNKKNHYVVGEMLDWDTRTGGYLLQACFSMGVALAMHLNSSR